MFDLLGFGGIVDVRLGLGSGGIEIVLRGMTWLVEWRGRGRGNCY